MKSKFRYYYKKKYLKSDFKEKSVPASTTVVDTPLKEKIEEAEKETKQPVTGSPIQADEPAIQETSFCKHLQVTIFIVIHFY